VRTIFEAVRLVDCLADVAGEWQATRSPISPGSPSPIWSCTEGRRIAGVR
jgi:hypothetical protein